jgi:hypothetical protein
MPAEAVQAAPSDDPPAHDEPTEESGSTDWKQSDQRRTVIRARFIVWVSLIVISIIVLVTLLLVKNNQYQSASDAKAEETSTSSRLENANREMHDLQDQMTNSYSPPSSAAMGVMQERARNVQKNIDDLQRSHDSAHMRATESWVLDDRWSYIWIAYVGIIAALIIASGSYLSYFNLERNRDFQNSQLIKKIVDEAPVDEFDLKTLWSANKSQIAAYHQIVQNYAQSTRQRTQLTLTAGFIFIILISVLALTRSTTASAISSSVIASAGAIVTGYIARATLKNSDTSARELSAFFTHPIDVERALAAERLIDSMPEGDRTAAKLIVVNYLAGGTISRQPSISPSDDGEKH